MRRTKSNQKDTIVLSIHSIHANNIYSGNKKAELRKSFPALCDFPFKALLYETSPKKEITGEVIVVDVIDESDYKRIVKLAHITESFARAYASGADTYLWILRNPRKYNKPLKIEDVGLTRAPMSWGYIND